MKKIKEAINNTKKWIFSSLCLGSKPDPTIDAFPCASCKFYIEEKCKLQQILKIEEITK